MAVMGRYSFTAPGARGPSHPWFRVGTLDVTTSVLVVLLGVASMLVWAFEGREHEVLGKLILLPDDVRDGQVWRVVTWPLVNDPSIWLVIMLAIFWYFGTQIEGLLGRNRFAVFLLTIAIVPGILGALIDLPQAGLRPIELAVFLLFVAEYPHLRFFFGIPGWVIGAVILGIDILQLLGDRNEKGILFLFVTLAAAALMARAMGLLANYPWIPAIPIGRLGDGTPRRQRRRRGRGGVISGPWSSSRGGPTGPLPQPPISASEATAAKNDQRELDALLDKISETGMDGLTSAEKQRLNELSKRLRDRR